MNNFNRSNYNWDGDFHHLRVNYELFYDDDDDDDGHLTQFRLHLKDEDPEIRKKVLILIVKTFTEPIFLFYEKHKTQWDKKIIEYYYDGSLETYTEITRVNSIEVIRFFNVNDLLFCTSWSIWRLYE